MSQLVLLSSTCCFTHSLSARKRRRYPSYACSSYLIGKGFKFDQQILRGSFHLVDRRPPAGNSKFALLGDPVINAGWRSSRAGKFWLTTPRASASSAAGARGPEFQSIWQALFTNLCAALCRFWTEFRKLAVGPYRGEDIVVMVRLLLLGCTALVAYVASKRTWSKIREHAAGKGGGEGGPMQVLARGATCVQSNMGPWSFQDFTLGLAAMAKVTEKEPPELPGKEVGDLAKDSEFLMRAQHWRAMAESAYVKDPASFSLFSQLPESSIVASEWDPCQESFRPAYVVAVDAPMGAVVLSVRGTSHVIDMLLNSGASPEPFLHGSAHGGFVHAANVLYEQALPHLQKAFESLQGSSNESNSKASKLIITGHSMGAAVGVLCALRLRDQFPNLECWAFCPPACLTLDLATECAPFTTSFVAAHDLVPRFSLHSVEKLRDRINHFDWDRVEKLAQGDDDWQAIKKALDTMQACQRAQENTMKRVNEKGEQISSSESGQKAMELGDRMKQFGEELANSEAAQRMKGVGQQAKEFVLQEGEDGAECNEEPVDRDSIPMLYPPGKLLLLGSDPPGCGKMPEQRNGVASQRNYGTYPSFDEVQRIRWVMHEVRQEDMEEIVVSPWCISDHMMGNMCEAIGYFQRQCPPVRKVKDDMMYYSLS